MALIRYGLLIGLSLSCLAASGAAAQAVEWTMHRSGNGTTVPFPATVFTVRVGEGKPRGEVFTSSDGRARLHLFAIPNERSEGPSQFIARVIADDRNRLTYDRVGRNFFVFSAPDHDRILYRRCNFARDRIIHCMDLRYPRGEKRGWDAIVTRMSLGLGPR